MFMYASFHASKAPKKPAKISLYTNIQHTRFLKGLKLLGLMELLSLFRFFFVYLTKGVLPAPFFLNYYDTFMDFFNTTFWAAMPGRYKVWMSLYPLFTFLIGDGIGRLACSEYHDPFQLRECGLATISFLIVAYIIGVSASVRIVSSPFQVNNLWSFVLIFFLIGLTGPGLFAIERGNYVVFVFALISCCVLLGESYVAAILLAMAVNLKPYLLILILLLFIRRRLVFFAWVIFFTISVDVISRLMVQESNYGVYLDNLVGFSQIVDRQYLGKLWLATSLLSWDRAFHSSPQLVQILSGDLAFLGEAFSLLSRSIRILLFGSSLFFICVYGRCFSQSVLASLILIGFSVFTDSAGGYSLILLIPFLVSSLGEGYFSRVFIFLVFIYTPLDFEVGAFFSNNNVSFFSGARPNEVAGIPLSALIRPVLLITVNVLMLFELWACRKLGAVARGS